MAIYYSSYFGVSHSMFEDMGVLDGYVDRDMNLHIDPLRLKNTQIKEFKNAYNNVFLKYFDRFVRFVDSMQSDSEEDMFFRLIVEHFMFDEIHNVSLGYSENGATGKGINEKLAKQLARTAVKIIRSGMRDPELFVFMHLFEKNIGADRISDMTVHILRKQILAYTERMSREMKLPVNQFTLEDDVFLVPYYNNEPIHFVPTTLLANLPKASSYEDIGTVDDYNTEIKRRVCNAVNGEWKSFVTGSGKKQVMKNALINSKKAYEEAIKYYRSLSAFAYDFTEDKKHYYFEARLKELVDNAIKDKNNPVKLTPEEVLAATREAVMLYKKCIENHRSYKLMYYEKGKVVKSEDYAQELLFIIAETYLKAKGFDIDLSPEADTGLGKLDFKFSQGAKSRVVVETKLTTNQDLLHGYITQLPDYMKAQEAAHGLYVAVYVDSNKNKLGQLRKLKDIQSKQTKDSPIEIVIIDAREKATASKRR